MGDLEFGRGKAEFGNGKGEGRQGTINRILADEKYRCQVSGFLSAATGNGCSTLNPLLPVAGYLPVL
jgi:hypothetical protein